MGANIVRRACIVLDHSAVPNEKSSCGEHLYPIHLASVLLIGEKAGNLNTTGRSTKYYLISCCFRGNTAGIARSLAEHKPENAVLQIQAYSALVKSTDDPAPLLVHFPENTRQLS